MPRPSPITRRIMAVLGDRQMTKADLARETAIDQSYFSHLESGKIQEPSPARLQQIANGLGVPVSSLLEPPPEPELDADELERIREALGPQKSHLWAQAAKALTKLPRGERDKAVDIIHTIVTNWPGES